MKVLGFAPLWLPFFVLKLVNFADAIDFSGGVDTTTTAFGDYATPRKVPVELYVEALCPGCQEFLVGPLAHVFKNGLIDIVDLYVVPYGNAKRLANGTIMCQHGPDECQLNRIESCAINMYRENYKWFDFMLCLEKKDRAEMLKSVDACAEKSGFSTYNLHECAEGPMGDKLMLSNELETEELKPPHRWTPWVVVDGKPITSDDLGAEFEYQICQAYKGPTPHACKKRTRMAEVVSGPGEKSVTFCTRDEGAMDL